MAGRLVIRRDHGWRRIKADVLRLRNQEVKVGLRAGKGVSDDGIPVVEYAYLNEFGTEHIPARPFLRRTADEAKGGPLSAHARNLVAGLIRGRLTVDGVLDGVGLWFRARVQATIRSAKSWAVPNAPYTIKRKGSSFPLIDDGRMAENVDYEKVRGGFRRRIGL